MFCSVVVDDQYFEATASSTKLARYHLCAAVLQYLKSEGIYDRKMAELEEKRALKRAKKMIRDAISSGTATAEQKEKWEMMAKKTTDKMKKMEIDPATAGAAGNTAAARNNAVMVLYERIKD